jgi:hypothetical protein
MGTTVGLKPSSMVYNSSTGSYSPVGGSGVLSVAEQQRLALDNYISGLNNTEDAPSVSYNPTASDIYGDIFAGYEGVRDPVTSAVSAAQASDYLLSQLEEQGVPDQVSNEEYFAKMNDTLLSLGIDPAQYTKLDSGVDTGLENDLLNNGVDMLDPNVTGLGGDETIVTDDPEAEWDKVDKTKDLASIFQDALDIFGAYDRNSIRKVVDVVNDRGVSAEEVARITGNTVESINQAAAESDTAITNQGIAEDTGAADTGDVFNEATDTLNTGEVLTASAPEDQGIIDPAGVTGGDEVIPVLETPVTPNDTPVIPVLDTPVIAEDPAAIVDDTPILPTIMQPTPKQTTNISLFQSIQDTPITDSLFFEPKFTELDNIPVGMFERFMQATGGR